MIDYDDLFLIFIRKSINLNSKYTTINNNVDISYIFTNPKGIFEIIKIKHNQYYYVICGYQGNKLSLMYYNAKITQKFHVKFSLPIVNLFYFLIIFFLTGI